MLISFIAFTAKRDVKDIQVSSGNVNVFRWTDVISAWFCICGK